ncbi:tail protein X [Roseibium sediminis]|uniref:tail protein X n=1 Tax=Roseibium sediminis TaxID=1775174 RepID=UPI00123CD836|nr:tail protein X [Roseibium sediminis]
MGLVIIGHYRVTEPEERLDRIAKALYGFEGNRAVERLLEANPELADTAFGPTGFVTFGTILAVPEPLEAEAEQIVRPWL